MMLKCSPTVSGECLYTSGFVDSDTTQVPKANAAWHIQISGSSATLRKIPDFCEVTALAWGAQVPGHSYSAELLVGWYNAADTGTTCNTTNFTYTYGIYESRDDGNTLTMIGQYPDNVFNLIRAAAGDQQTLGEWFVGTAGMGWFYFKPTNGGHG